MKTLKKRDNKIVGDLWHKHESERNFYIFYIVALQYIEGISGGVLCFVSTTTNWYAEYQKC